MFKKYHGRIKFVVLACAVFAMVAGAEMRIWTSLSGDTVEAEYTTMLGSKVVLKTADGRQIQVPVSGLCKADRDYLVSAIPPKMKISVDVDVDRQKQGDGYYFEKKEETYSVGITIEKVNREPSNRSFKARLYVLAQSKESDRLKLIATEEKDFSFSGGDSIRFSAAANISSLQGYTLNWGYKYHGYLVCIEDQDGKVIQTESNQSYYGEHLKQLKSMAVNSEMTRDFVAIKK